MVEHFFLYNFVCGLLASMVTVHVLNVNVLQAKNE